MQASVIQPVVELCRAELWHACDVGTKRKAMHRVALAKGEKRPDRNEQRGGVEKDPWHEVESACAEYATAKYLRRWWPGNWWSVGKTVDIPPDIEVRWTEYEATGRLLVYDQDNPLYRYVLVTGTMPSYRLIGWIYGRDAMDPRFRGRLKPDRPEMQIVPREELLPVTELMRFDEGGETEAE